MPLIDLIQPDAVGFYAVVCPAVFWQAAYLRSDYQQVAETASAMLGDDAFEIVQAAGQLLVDSFKQALRPEIKRLPVNHPDKQAVIRKNVTAGSLIAHLTGHRYFVVVLRDNVARFEPMRASSVEGAREMLMARSDVQQIERHHVELH